MNLTQLPVSIRLDQLSSGQHHWQGSLPAQQMPRLRELVIAVESAGAQFTIEALSAGVTIQGSCQARLQLHCERCLQAMTTEIVSEFELTAVDTPEQADALEADRLAVVAPRGELDVCAMVEDELILGLPVVARHEDVNCSEAPRAFGPEGAEAQVKRENPFDVLAGLKTRPSDDVE